jgi:glycopeptide antibiotics resistance protein
MSDLFQAYITVGILYCLLKFPGLTKVEYYFKGGQNISCSVEDDL